MDDISIARESRKAAEELDALKRMAQPNPSLLVKTSNPEQQATLAERRMRLLEDRIDAMAKELAAVKKDGLRDEFNMLKEDYTRTDAMLSNVRSIGNVRVNRYSKDAMIVEGPSKDDFALSRLTSKSVRVAPGLVMPHFLREYTTTAGYAWILSFTASTDLTLGTAQYATIYAQAQIDVNSLGKKQDSSSPIVAVREWTDWQIPIDAQAGAGYTTQTLHFPLYCLKAQSGADAAWDNYELVHDCRYGIRFTIDVQGYLSADGSAAGTPFP